MGDSEWKSSQLLSDWESWPRFKFKFNIFYGLELWQRSNLTSSLNWCTQVLDCRTTAEPQPWACIYCDQQLQYIITSVEDHLSFLSPPLDCTSPPLDRKPDSGDKNLLFPWYMLRIVLFLDRFLTRESRETKVSHDFKASKQNIYSTIVMLAVCFSTAYGEQKV